MCDASQDAVPGQIGAIEGADDAGRIGADREPARMDAAASAAIAEVESQYVRVCGAPSDIYEHLPTLRALAASCHHVTEMGIRGVVSTWAMAAGLCRPKAATPRTLIGVDLAACDVARVAEVLAAAGVDYRFIRHDSATVALDPTDLLFIDTWHVYAHLRRELAAHHAKVARWIVMHDTTVDAVDGESLRMGLDVAAQSRASGYPEAEIRMGLWPAVEEFLAEHPEWSLFERFVNNNGLTILERRDPQ